jgi:hypothetical protein
MVDVALRISRDFVRDRKASFLLWWFPALLMIATGPLGFSPELHGSIWASCLSVFGFGCLANARRCGRRHCFFTGPFFLAMALVSLVHGFGVISLGSYAGGSPWLGRAPSRSCRNGSGADTQVATGSLTVRTVDER